MNSLLFTKPCSRNWSICMPQYLPIFNRTPRNQGNYSCDPPRGSLRLTILILCCLLQTIRSVVERLQILLPIVGCFMYGEKRPTSGTSIFRMFHCAAVFFRLICTVLLLLWYSQTDVFTVNRTSSHVPNPVTRGSPLSLAHCPVHAFCVI